MTRAERAQVRQMIADAVAEARAAVLAEVGEQLASLDRGIVEGGTAAAAALARADALGRALTQAFEITGHALPAGAARLPSRLAAVEQQIAGQGEAWSAMREIGDRREADQAVEAAQALPRHGLRALPGGVA